MRLPIDDSLPALLATLAAGNTAVLQAPPGAGKTTRVPPALLDQPWLGGRRILMLEPRRIAARAAARFMAGQLGEAVGATVGYRSRFDSRTSAVTRIEVITEGILTRLIQRDPALSGYGAVIFDEFHERSLQADLGLALVREAQQALREDLRLLVMSATLDGARVADCLRPAPVLQSAGRSHPVTVRYSPPGRRPWLAHLADLLTALSAAADSGSLLVFLPGTGEIRRLAAALDGRLPPDMDVAPLYADLPPAVQDAAIAPPAGGRRKLVLATAIAETSLTIEGIRTVVDAGFDRRPVFAPGSGLTRLETVRVSAAAAEQRAGRAGRLGPGQCIRLWPESERLAAFQRAEMLDADLAGLVLELAQWGCRDPATLTWLDPPPAAAWAQGRILLQQLEAVDGQGAITAHGRDLLRLPLEPRLAHMVQRGRERGLGRLACELAVLLSERDPLPEAGCDVAPRLEALRSGAGIDRGRWRHLRQLLERLQPGPPAAQPPDDAAGQLLALAFPERLAQRRPGGLPRYRLANGRGASLPEHDRLAACPWLVAAALDGAGREARVFLAAPIHAHSLESLFAAHIETRDEAGWDAVAGAVRGRRRRCLGALVLAEQPQPVPDPERCLAAMMDGIRQLGCDGLPWTDAIRQWRARVGWMARLDVDGHWPTLDDASLLATLETWAAPWLAGIDSREALQGFPLAAALAARLSPEQTRQLEQALPTHLTVPSGSRIAIDYRPDSGPVVAVKLQEVFGLQQSPPLAAGRLPLTWHLLSPARRPAAVTADLASFWRQGYPQVRRELRGRYPRHPWPEDPLTAIPQRGVKR